MITVLVILIALQSALWLRVIRPPRLSSAFAWGLMVQLFIPYGVVVAADSFMGIEVIRRGPHHFSLTNEEFQWVLVLANLLLAVMGTGYSAVSLLLPKRASVPATALPQEVPRPRFAAKCLLIALLIYFAIWLVAVQGTVGIAEFIRNPLIFRGNAEEGNLFGFLLPLTSLGIVTLSFPVLTICFEMRKHWPLSRSLFFASLVFLVTGTVVWAQGGRGLLIAWLAIGFILASPIRSRTTFFIAVCLSVTLFLLVTAFGHSLFSLDAWQAGIIGSIADELDNTLAFPEQRLQKFVTFGQSIIHPILVQDAMESGLAPHNFRDVPYLPLAFIPFGLHGIQYPHLQTEFMQLFPDPGANNNIKILTYLLWGGGEAGVVFGGFFLGAFFRVCDYAINPPGLHPTTQGPSIFLAYTLGSGLMNGGPISLRDCIPIIIAVLLVRIIVSPKPVEVKRVIA